MILGININSPSAKAQTQLKVIEAKVLLKHGDTGIITIQGKANTNYTIKTSYVLGDREISVAQMRASDERGMATFNWVVDERTAPGTRTAVISGGGETIELTHTVTQ
jgi:alpha-D-ribose 1-methylphosphonate 5-triphosphate synthase subunit PhnG